MRCNKTPFIHIYIRDRLLMIPIFSARRVVGQMRGQQITKEMSERQIVFTLTAIQIECSASTIFRKFLLPGALSNEIEVYIGSIFLLNI